MDHVTAIITQLAQGLFESIGSSLLRTVRGKGLRIGFQLRLLHQPTRHQDRPRQLAVYRIDLRAQSLAGIRRPASSFVTGGSAPSRCRK